MARDHYDANIDFQVMQKLIAEMEQHYRDAGVEFENWEIGSRIEKALRVQLWRGDHAAAARKRLERREPHESQL